MSKSGHARAAAHSKYHPGKSCSPCLFCGKIEAYYKHFQAWPESMKQFAITHFKKPIADSSCICQADYLEIKRHRSDPEYVPKWVKTIQKLPVSSVESKCSYDGCTASDKLIKPSFTSIENVQEMLHIPPEDTQTILLCPVHYHQLYKKVKLVPCSNCGACPKLGSPFFRHSPDPNTVSHYISSATEDTPTITAADCLCLSCYKAHLAILKHINECQNTVSARLQNDIELWRYELSNTEDRLKVAELETVLHVAKNLQHQEAILLPTASAVFLDSYCGAGQWSSDVPVVLEMSDSTVKFSHKWLLHLLIIYLQPYMQYKCVIKKIGTLLYPRDGDPLISLSWALHQQNKHEYQYKVVQLQVQNQASTINLAGAYLNELLLNEIKILSEFQQQPKQLDIDWCISKCDPMIWDFLVRTTQSGRELSGSQQSPTYKHTKKVRRFFIYCLLMYCIQLSYKSPIHLALTDAIEVCGGSRELIRILNRLGVSVSTDVHDNFVATIAEEARQTKVWDLFDPEIFTIITADNFDLLKRHAAVYCGNQYRSFHGTTIQVVQPDSTLRVHTNSGGEHQLQPSVPQKRNVSQSPGSSPHQLGKKGPKRRRTVTPMSPIGKFSRPHGSHSMSRFIEDLSVDLSVDQFKESEREGAEYDNISSQVFAYLTHKCTVISTEKTLKELNEFLTSMRGFESPKESRIHYMELLNENADSQETMLHVSDYLLSELHSDIQDGWVILVGDGKTYEHLHGIKELYGEELEKLLIFPGDWHVLKNFQPLLMQMYYAAGLKQIAEASGFKGETLTSLEKCSNLNELTNF